MLVYVILVNWNGWSDTAECLDACMHLEGAEFRLLVVDNASTDESVTELSTRYPQVRLVRSEINLGFAGGNNLGIRIALDEGADLVWLLNNDTTVAPDALKTLVECAREHPEAGMFGSKVYFYNSPTKIWSAGGELAPTKAGYPRHTGANQPDDGRWESERDVEYLSGCSLLVRREVIERIGMLREDYFMYWEDVDWSVRAQEAGWSCRYVPKSRVWHKVSASLKNAGFLDLRYETRNRLYFYTRNRPKRLAGVELWTLRDVASLWVRGKWADGAARLAGVLDFLLGRTGPIRSPRKAA
jgi:GT2 family glycosyltransferase